MSNLLGSWLSGPQAALEDGLAQQDYQGEFLGLPQQGNGSLASQLQRVGALMIDWTLAWLSSALLINFAKLNIGMDVSTATYLLWLVLGIVFVSLFAQTPGQAVVGIGVARIDQPLQRVGLLRAIVRSVLIAFIAPAVITDADNRGMHDRATGTALIRTR